MNKYLMFVCVFIALLRANQYDYLLFSNVISDVESGLELKADVNGKINGITPLFQAVRGNHLEIAYILVVMGANVNEEINTETPLHIAARNRNPLLVELLVTAGAKINVQDKNGNTPLHYAAMNGDSQSLSVLTRNNGDMSIRNFNGYTPSQFIISEIIVSPIIVEDLNIAVTASSFKLGSGGVTFNMRNLTNEPLTVFSTGLYINGVLSAENRQPFVIPPGTTLMQVSTMYISPSGVNAVKPNENGIAEIKAGFNIDYEAEGRMGRAFNSAQINIPLWNPPPKKPAPKKNQTKQPADANNKK